MIDTLHQTVQRITAKASLALRVTLLTAGAVAVTLAAISAIVYVVVRAQFESSLDASMLDRATAAVEAGFNEQIVAGTRAETLAIADVRVDVLRGGQIFSGSAQDREPESYLGLPELEVSIGTAPRSTRTTTIEGQTYRVVAVPAGPGSALVLAQPMDSIERALARLQVILLLSTVGGVALSALAGWAVARNGLRPVRRLTAATEHVARTQELRPIAVTGRDELARLTTSFNQMLTALDASQERQRQLVADAGHELRTPLTSLRTNIELLGQAAENPDRTLSADERTEIMTDVRVQLDELTTLVGDLVELAREEPLRRDPEPLDLADVVTAALARIRPRAVGLTMDVELESWTVVGEPSLLERAITNLLDNAVKWSPDGGTVTVRLEDGTLSVSDQGPGIDETDLPHVFDRFYRAREARALPGSGLGLSIVRRAAERHRGTVAADEAPGGGARFCLTLPGVG